MPITIRKAVNSTRSGSGRLRSEIGIGLPLRAWWIRAHASSASRSPKSRPVGCTSHLEPIAPMAIDRNQSGPLEVCYGVAAAERAAANQVRRGSDHAVHENLWQLRLGRGICARGRI